MNINLTINGKPITATQGQTILEAAANNGIHIPTLCNDERVVPSGACGVCVVSVEKSARLLRACSTMAADGMVIDTETARVREARNSAISLLLSDHTGDCRPPCSQACPANTDCQGYVGLIANGAYREALSLIREKLPIPGCIGRVCPAPCEGACRREMVEEPISIAHLKTFAADTAKAMGAYPAPTPKADTGKHIGIVGGGPGGLTAANFLRLGGHQVTIYDAMPHMGGMLRYGIPSYRLPREVLDDEISQIEALGVTMKNGVKIGQNMTFDHLRQNHDAVLLAIGAWQSAPLRCPGEEHAGVVGGIDFLREVAMGELTTLSGKHVAVVGGGNTAMDACRTAVRLGAESVTNIYRRTKAEMPAQAIEIQEAEEEGVIFKFLTNPLEIQAENGHANNVRLQQMELGEPDASGRRSPVPIPNAEENLAVDLVLLAIGQNVNPTGLDGVELTRWKTIIADEGSFATNLTGVFAVGDATNNGASIAIEAIGEAQKAAVVIDKFLTTGEEVAYKPQILVVNENVTPEEFADVAKAKREAMPHVKPELRRKNFDSVNLGYSEEQAKSEAHRCLECGCSDYFECKLLHYANVYNVGVPTYTGDKTDAPLDLSHKYITRNPEKCILCGLCVRVCEQTMDTGALGFDGRGFGTAVKPAFDQPLTETDCTSCGQCVALCPTGALAERLPLAKNVPLAETRTHSVCTNCGNGCNVTYTSHGSLLLRALPRSTDENPGILCEVGRFGQLDIQQNRATVETMHKNGQQPETDNDGIYDVFRLEVTGVISGSYTNETVAIIMDFFKEIQAKNVYALKGKPADWDKLTPSQLKEIEGNSRGLENAGVNMNTAALEADIASGKIEALYILGSEFPAHWRNKVGKIIIATPVMSESAHTADYVVPYHAPFERAGTITDVNGQMREVKAAVAQSLTKA